MLGGLALALAVLVGQRIIQAQGDLAAAARAVGRGETIAPPEMAVREGNRIGEELAQASVRLGEQAAALVEANRQLESKIEKRTRDLAASEARARLLSENASDVITLMGTSLRRLYASPASRDVLGYTPDELMGGTPIAIVHPEDAEGLKGKLQALARGEVDRARSIHCFRHKRGSCIWVEVNFRLVRSEGGAPQEIVSIIRDISERRQLEEHLRESQKIEAVGQLTGGIAHEFNNLLMVVLGNAEILAEEVRDPQLQKLALAIQGSAERGSDLTQKLLAFGCRQSLRPERLDLDGVVRDMVPLLRHALGRGIEIVTDVPAEPVFALADSTLLQSSILNLAINARDAMPGGGTVVVRTGQLVAGPKDGGLPCGQPVAFVTVSASGTGIAPTFWSGCSNPSSPRRRSARARDLGFPCLRLRPAIGRARYDREPRGAGHGDHDAAAVGQRGFRADQRSRKRGRACALAFGTGSRHRG